MPDADAAAEVTPEAMAAPPHSSPAASLSAVAFPDEGNAWGIGEAPAAGPGAPAEAGGTAGGTAAAAACPAGPAGA